MILIFKRFGEKDGDEKGKRENDEAALLFNIRKKKQMLESIHTYKYYRSRNE